MGLLEYRHPYVTVDLLLFSVIDNSLAICLTKRDEEPFKGMYSLPGTFIHEDESGEGAVERLLADKLQIPKQNGRLAKGQFHKGYKRLVELNQRT